MIVNIAHPTWLIGRVRRGRVDRLLKVQGRTAVDIKEVPESSTEIAFRVLEVDRPSLALLTLPDSSEPRSVWWPIVDKLGVPVPMTKWLAGIEGEADGFLRESGLAQLRDTTEEDCNYSFGPDDIRHVSIDYRHEATSSVLRAAAGLIICNGVVWRRRAEPMYCIQDPVRQMAGEEARNGLEVAVGHLFERGEREACFQSVHSAGASEAEAIERLTVDACIRDRATYFRADETNAAVQFWQSRRPSTGGDIVRFPHIEVLKPECVRSVPSVIQLKAATSAYLACVLDFVPRLRDVLHYKGTQVYCAFEEAREAFTSHSEVRQFLSPVATLIAMVDRDKGLVSDGIEELEYARSDLEYAVGRFRNDIAIGRLRLPGWSQDEEEPHKEFTRSS